MISRQVLDGAVFKASQFSWWPGLLGSFSRWRLPENINGLRSADNGEQR